MGLPLCGAANVLSSLRSRGRHGNALQWHFGLDPHDGRAVLDWEDRIEIKLVSVWRRSDGEVGCDKLKVCDLAIDPWHKLGNVLWVFADRLTRVVVGAALSRLAGGARERLEASWALDPHFEHPLLFVEAREQEGRSAPAYYLAARWFEEERLLPAVSPSIFPFDTAWWKAARAEHKRDPWLTLVDGSGDRIACPRCGGALHFEGERVRGSGWAPAHHAWPVGDACILRAHAVIDGRRLAMSPWQTPEEFRAALESRLTPDALWRLADRVPEPEDHEHVG